MRIADWAVLIYSGPSRDIEAPARASLEEVAAAHLPDGVVVGAQLAEGGEARRFRFGGQESVAMGPVDMSRPDSLSDFLRWGLREFPARHYAVVVGGHAAGFLGAVTDPDRHRLMPLPAIASALHEIKPDVVAFNACMMGQAETAVQLGAEGFLVATPQAEKGLGMPLGQWLEALPPHPDAAAVANGLARACQSSGERAPGVTAFPLECAPALQAGLERLGATMTPANVTLLQSDLDAVPACWPQGWDHPLSDYRPLAGALQAWEGDARLSAELRSACRDLRMAVPPGLSLYLPEAPLASDRVDQAFHALALSGGQWGQAVDLLKSQAGRQSGPRSTPGDSLSTT